MSRHAPKNHHPKVAVRSAFARSVRAPGWTSPSGFVARTRLHPWALAFVVGFPGVIGILGLATSLARPVLTEALVFVGVLPTVTALLLLVLGLRSEACVDSECVSVRFFGIRTTTVRFDELRSATFGMPFPSISFTLVLRDEAGHKVRIHANWWLGEGEIVRPVLRRALELDVPMDRTAARIASEVLGVKRPKARIVHHGLINKKRTW